VNLSEKLFESVVVEREDSDQPSTLTSPIEA